jgi:hypothetical protein
VHAAEIRGESAISLMPHLPAVALPWRLPSAIGKSNSWHDKAARYDALVSMEGRPIRTAMDSRVGTLPGITGGGTATICMHTLADANNAEYQSMRIHVRSMDLAHHGTDQRDVTRA